MEALLASVREDRAKVSLVLEGEALPADVKALLTGEKFQAQVQAKFKQYDTDQSDKLTADELVPVVMLLNREHPEVEVTEEYCKSFLAAFDTDGNGSLCCDEFCEFMKFLYVMVKLKDQVKAAAAEKAALGQAEADEEARQATD